MGYVLSCLEKCAKVSRDIMAICSINRKEGLKLYNFKGVKGKSNENV